MSSSVPSASSLSCVSLPPPSPGHHHHDVTVTIFSVPACPNCQLLKQLLRRERVAFRDIPLKAVAGPDARPQRRVVDGAAFVPYVFFDNVLVARGFHSIGALCAVADAAAAAPNAAALGLGARLLAAISLDGRRTDSWAIARPCGVNDVDVFAADGGEPALAAALDIVSLKAGDRIPFVALEACLRDHVRWRA
jgi:glutaredoxin